MIAAPNTYSVKGYDVVATGDASITRITKGKEDEVGELYIQGPNVFSKYWNRPEETKAAFTSDGWFKTGVVSTTNIAYGLSRILIIFGLQQGDIVQYIEGSYKILGRSSVDIIKSGGYKLSALDIERHLLSNNDIAECAVVGLPDITWGQKVAAVVVLKPHRSLTAEQIREWCRDRLPPYAVPSLIKIVPELLRSSIGKINKKELINDVFKEDKL